MPGGSAPRRKGVQAERDFVNWLKARGLYARRVPLSGAAGGPYTGDVAVWGLDAPPPSSPAFVLEVKAIKGTAKTIRRWMQNALGLVIKVERTAPEHWLVVLPAAAFVELLRGSMASAAGTRDTALSASRDSHVLLLNQKGDR